jgi:dCTP deaminase
VSIKSDRWIRRVAQFLFFESDEQCETTYADRKGKYQGQRGVTLPKA